MVELITTKHNKAYCLHMNTICCISDHAYQENRTSHQGIGTVAQDSAKINSGIEHDYMTNTLKEGNKSHHSAIFLQIFQALAWKVKDSQCNGNVQEEDEVVQQNTILDNLPLAQEHIVFKFSSINPQVKCSEIVASENVMKVMPGIITSMIIALGNLLPMVSLEIGMATSDAASCMLNAK